MITVILFQLFCLLCLGQEDSLSPSSNEVHQRSASCDLTAYSTFLASGRDGSKTNGELLSDYSIACRGGIKLLTQGMFGPPTVYDMFIVGCSGDCQRWDALQQQGRSSSRCSCEDLDTCDQVTSFWLCKTLYECRSPEDHRNLFCNGCGTGQRDEFDFYEEIDCGSANKPLFVATICCWIIFIVSLILLF